MRSLTRYLQNPFLTAVFLALTAVGCAPEPEVFDKAAIDGLHKMMVLPLPSPQEPSAGVVVAGVAGAQLKAQRFPRLEVLEAPALWRLTASSTQPVTISQEEAIRAAQAVGADCVLTGAVDYAVSVPKDASNLPPAMRGAKGQSMEYQKSFIVRKADVTVTVRILAVESARPVYVHKASSKGECGSRLLSESFQKAVKPFEDYVRSSRKK